MKPIAIVQGGESAMVQGLFRDFVLRNADLRIAGAIEEPGERGGGRRDNRLRSLGDGMHYPVFQHLGAGAAGCALDPKAIVTACEAVRRDISAGCDVVVLSKFGKLEAESGSGFVAAFAGAIDADVPILTSVSPRYADAWNAFASPFFMTLPAEGDAIDDWWRAVCVRPVGARYA